MSKLTQKQKRFCEEYLIDLNATQAAIRAGYSENTAKEMGYENLTKPHIANFISEKQKEVRDRNEITVDFVVNGIRDIAVLGEHENNRLKAYEILGKHLGIYEKDNSQKNNDIIVVGMPKVDGERKD
ncbi:terminase small subunit [Sulfurovum sp. XTW-4]|uniref:Terminase small subunit n=1 Tax=Sulfurovum xiamenensis TaxID=3019066 RepID=A0ABT7QUB6_9BACT|nr:terminase small subunit [Sulfurovum xiamenensis]MDM5264691.1 terminase small subunit [Sulfurovum xiamenensis]